MYHCPPPLHTVPYYDHTPYRPTGVFVAAALSADIVRLPDSCCVDFPDAENWHHPNSFIPTCGQGFVIFSSVEENLQIKVTALRGSGCNSFPMLECTPFYPLDIPLKVGRNNVIWCTESCISIARSEFILDPWEDIATDMGSVLYFPHHPFPSLKNYVLTGDTYHQVQHPQSPIQPTMMSFERVRAVCPPRFTIYSPPGTIGSLTEWCLRNHPISPSAPVPSTAMGNTIRLSHRVLPIAIPPPRCACGAAYIPTDEDYTTGGPPNFFADD